jgi:sulfofructose kinase
MFDILGLGVTAIDTLLYVDDYPAEESKVPVQKREHRLGGLTGAALVAAARLRAQCVYAGILGYGQLSEDALRQMQQEGIDVSQVVRREGAGPVESFIIVSSRQHTRTILHDSRLLCGADENLPEANLIREARVLFVDHHGVDGMIRAARIAKEAGIPIVGDLEKISGPRFMELFALVDHLIVSYGFASRLSGETEPQAIIERLWGPDRKVVVVTRGIQGAWYRGCQEPGVAHQPAFAVETVDSTGCGDVFHGAYAALLAQGWDVAERIRVAAAAAAIKAADSGEQAGMPGYETVMQFLKTQSV